MIINNAYERPAIVGRRRSAFFAAAGALGRRLTIACAGALLMGCAAEAQSRHPVSGRLIAPVMGVGGHTWLDRVEREAEEAPSKAIELLNIRPGMSVADVGAGSGYYTVRLAKRVGGEGRVFATDVQRGMLDIIERKTAEERLGNVTTVLGTEDNPTLPPGALDLILMVDVYHELQAPQPFMRRLREALKPDGRLVLLEFRKEDPRVPIQELHKMSVADVRRELAADGFAFDRVIDGLPWQHIIVLKPAQ